RSERGRIWHVGAGNDRSGATEGSRGQRRGGGSKRGAGVLVLNALTLSRRNFAAEFFESASLELIRNSRVNHFVHAAQDVCGKLFRCRSECRAPVKLRELGRGLIKAQPWPDRCKLDEGEVVGGQACHSAWRPE